MIANNSNWQTVLDRSICEEAELTCPSISLIDSQSVLEVKGPDAIKFLQGQCSADIEALEEGLASTGAICTVKGRVVCSFVALKHKQRILLRISTDLINTVKQYLSKYAAFYKVELIVWPAPSVLSSKESFSQATFIPLTYSLGKTEFIEFLIEPDQLNSVAKEIDKSEMSLQNERDWQQAQIASGWLNVSLQTTELYLPHQLNLELHGAISFTKGCYTGQEIIARTEYRGKPKRRLHLISLNSSGADSWELPIEMLDSAAKKLGSLVAISKGTLGLAILPTDVASQFEADIGDLSLNIKVPPQPYSI